MSGLRERKKAQTRLAIQYHALRLFRKHGYENTTVRQIADAAEVSESTFFRYFPTKEEVVLWDDLDLSFAARFRAQPTALDSFEAMRTAMRDTFTELPTAQRQHLQERVGLMMSVPPLRASLLDQLIGATRVMSDLVTQRSGTGSADPAVCAVVGAIIGAGFSAVIAAQDNPGADFTELLDETLGHLATVASAPR
ncbi:TetR family transcriptional regulator [Nocardia sp. NBC_01730]|uniref:acyl-CoA-like ligand-binding transcription factor n=1 Tax=Nocardia sp. NBC_01730 TaxID=2975998 RepID=UPI002E158245|nr:TetR family transcriptional regulator [Nocardia sp. NBC_01730]